MKPMLLAAIFLPLGISSVLAAQDGATDLPCITNTQYQTLRELAEGLRPHVDKAQIYRELASSSRLLAERLARVKDCQKESTYIDKALNSCETLRLDYNSQVEEHNAILRRLETANKLQEDFNQMKQRLALPRCK